jgi:AcrR family transcriptional regulator/DNA-binding MarR family transcriptional regulator
VEDDERTRIFRAMAVAVCADGVRSVTLADVAARADVSQRKLRARYKDLEECFLATFEWSSQRAGTAMVRAYHEESRWVEGVRAALAAMLELIEQEPALARLWIVHSLGAGSRVLRSRTEAIAVLCEYIDRGRQESGGRVEPPAITAEGVVGALLAVLQTRLLASDPEPDPGPGSGLDSGSGLESGPRLGSGLDSGPGPDSGPEPLSDLLGELMSVVLLPYLGSAAAKRELLRPIRRPSQPRHSGRSVMDGVGMRLTYRTARVLMAIAERPGASNREVGDRSEVVDQGQISKLLSRLESQGLIANIGGGDLRGAPNAWELTPRGEQVEHAARRITKESAEHSLPQ